MMAEAWQFDLSSKDNYLWHQEMEVDALVCPLGKPSLEATLDSLAVLKTV